MAEFPYSQDVGTSSWQQVANFAKGSGAAFSVTSSFRPGDPGYHGKGNAVDMAGTKDAMVQLAAWLMRFAAFELELIHSGGGGFFVKNGKQVDAAYYGSATVSEHYNHVHCAMTLSGLQAASHITPVTIPVGATTTIALPQGAGCVLPAILIGGGLLTVGGIAWEAITHWA